MDGWVVSPGVQAIEYGDTLLLLDERRGHLRAYAGEAARIWSMLDRLGMVESAAVSDWLDAGFLQAPGLPASGPAQQAGAVDWRNVPPPAWADRWHCRLGGICVGFSVEHPRGAGVIRRLLKPFETDEGDPALRIEVRDTGPYEAAVIRDGIEMLRTNDQGLLLGAIYQGLLERIYGVDRWYALVHGGAVALNGRAIAFPAASGSGKTTLVAGLIASGFHYLADDLVAISAPDGMVAAWPMPLSIKAGSWDLLEALHPQLAGAPSFVVKDTRARLLMPAVAGWDRNMPLDAFVFPTWRAGATARLDRLSPDEAFVRLLNDRVWLGYPLRAAAVRAFLDWLKTISCFSLDYSRLEDAESLVRSLVTS